MIRIRTITPLLVLALSAPIAVAAPAQAADTVLAPAPATAGITAYGGQVVLSQIDPTTGKWALMRLQSGVLSPLPVAEQSVPFDADAGPDAAGKPVVVYSRCSVAPSGETGTLSPSVDWETASGCQIYELTLTGTPAEHELTAASTPGKSETTPSIWKGNLAFVRHSAGAPIPTIEYLPVNSNKPRHLGGGSVQLCTQDDTHNVDCGFKAVHDTVDQLDLGPSGVGYVWNMTGGSVYGVGIAWELRSATLTGTPSALLDTGLISGTCGFSLPSAPTVTTGSISYLEASAPCDNTVTQFATANPVTGIRALAPATAGLAAGAVRDGDTIYWLRASGSATDVPVPASSSCTVADAGCQLVATPVPGYTTQPVRQQFPLADVDLANSGLGYKWVTESGGVRVLRPPATLPCSPSAVPAEAYVSAQWSHGKHTVRVSRKDPGKAARAVTTIKRSLPPEVIAAGPKLVACGDSTKLTYAVTTGGRTQRVSFTVARTRAAKSA
ncbi:MAG TPA: hypothetical protein VHW26_07845 [Solirubrobacteraceae bacterium]|jgi:hypothetical protein|nr:hypothetical protein [Solirubrobacteraceae bacterium]